MNISREKERPLIPDLINIHELVDVVITTLDARDPYTYEHSFRVAYYSELISRHMNFTRDVHQKIHIAAHLHDIGKIGVKDSVLNKPGRLTEDEMKEIQTHPRIGHNILIRLPNFKEVAKIVLHHHERFDGKGYPDGLKGEDIPLESRIITVADAFDAMTSDRPYRKGMTFEKAMIEIDKQSGTQFDPIIANNFRRVFGDLTRFASTDFLSDIHHAYVGHEELMRSKIAMSDSRQGNIVHIAS